VFKWRFFSSSFPSFPFAQELQTNLISKKLLFSVLRDAHAPQMRNSGQVFGEDPR